MTNKQLKKLRKQLEEMRKSPQGRKAADLEEFAKALGRSKVNRGKEPTWAKETDPELSPPLSIPHHGAKDLAIGTARSIIDTLLSDCDEWEIFLLEQENEEDD